MGSREQNEGVLEWAEKLNVGEGDGRVDFYNLHVTSDEIVAGLQTEHGELAVRAQADTRAENVARIMNAVVDSVGHALEKLDAEGKRAKRHEIIQVLLAIIMDMIDEADLPVEYKSHLAIGYGDLMSAWLLLLDKYRRAKPEDGATVQ